MDQTNSSLARDIDVIARRNQEPRLFSIGEDAEVLLVPQVAGMQIAEVDKLRAPFRPKPKRREGTAIFHDLDTFVDWVNRHKDADSVVFANTTDPANLSVTAILDYNKAGGDGVETARFGRHRGFYAFPLSRIWKAWKAIEAKGWMKQIDFAQMLEDRIADVLPVPPKDTKNPAEIRLRERWALLDPSEDGPNAAGPVTLQALARGLEIHESSKLTNIESLHSGTGVLKYESAHTDSSGEAIKVPTCFAIRCPVFERDAAYLLPIRLRYRKNGGALFWSCAMYDADTFFEDAITLALKRFIEGRFEQTEESAEPKQVAPGVGLPLFLGVPESPSS